jgi:hypothetical protein
MEKCKLLGCDAQRNIFFSYDGNEVDNIFQDGIYDSTAIFLKVDEEQSCPAFLRSHFVCVELTNHIFDIFHALSPQKTSFHRNEHKVAFRGGFDLVPREINREILAVGPWFEQIYIMGIFWIS